MAEHRLGPHVQSPLDGRLDHRLGGIHPVGVDAAGQQCLTRLPLPHSACSTRPVTPDMAATAVADHQLEPGIDLGDRAGRQLGGPLRVDRSLQVLHVVDDHVEHAGHRPGELDDLVDDEADVPAHRLADQPFDETPDELLRLGGHGHVHVGRTVHQGQGLAEPGPAMQPDRRELEEQLVELALEPGREIARGPPAPDFGVDFGHDLGQVLGPGRGVGPVGGNLCRGRVGVGGGVSGG